MFKPQVDYNYYIENNILYIIDLDQGHMSVTNGAEYVLTNILQKEGDRIKNMKVKQYDTNKEWGYIEPHWEGNECINVEFY